MMKVYILVVSVPYSVDNEVKIEGVYDSEKKAKKGWEEFQEDGDSSYESYDIEEWEVE